MSKEPWSVFADYWGKLVALASGTQKFMSSVAWAMSPIVAYTWIIDCIEYCRRWGVPTLDQPSWMMFQDLLRNKISSLTGSPANAFLTQVMEDWRDYDYTKPLPPNPYIPDPGPYSVVVAGYNKIYTLLVTASNALFASEANRDVDYAGRTITLYEVAYIVHSVVRKACDNPMFQMRDPQVPKWFMPYPWLDYIEQDLRQLRDALRMEDFGGQTFNPGDTPWSKPE